MFVPMFTSARTEGPDAPRPLRIAPSTLAAVAAGLLATGAMSPLRGTGWLILPALALLFGALAATGRPARVGWFFGLAHQASLLHWLFFLGPDAPIASRGLVPVAGASAILYCSLYYLVFGWAAGRVRRHLGAATAIAAMPVLWTGMEAWRSAGELGFPWCLSGFAWLETPLLSLARASGELALGFATAMTAAALVAGWRRRSDGAGTVLGTGFAAAAVWVLLAWGSGWRSDPPTVPDPAIDDSGAPIAAADEGRDGRAAVRIAAVQANVSLHDKWRRGARDSSIVPYTALTRRAAAAGADLVVWAETSVPAYLLYERPLLDWVRGQARDNGVHLLCGFPDARLGADGERRRYNGAGLFGPGGVLVDRYGKHHLLPFGEKVPFQGLIPALGDLDFGQAEWDSGDRPHPMAVDLGARSFAFGPLICYESIFADLTRGAVREGAGVLVNITNDGWFGDSAGPVQHADMARVRAVECGVPLVRCANNGISFLCGPDGRIEQSAGIDRRTVLVGDVEPRAGRTLYVALGHLPLLAAMLLWSAAVLAGRLFGRSR